jgi:acetyl-CoA carboxylase carboxyltransferase component
MPAEGGADAAGVDGDTKAVLQHAELGGAYAAADTMSYDEIVDPTGLRAALLDALRLTAARRQLPVRPVRHLGVLP